MNALDDYKRKSGRMFPTCSEILEVIHSIGYAKLSSAEMAARNGSQQPMEPQEDLVGPDVLSGQLEEGSCEEGSCEEDPLAAAEPVHAQLLESQTTNSQWPV